MYYDSNYDDLLRIEKNQSFTLTVLTCETDKLFATDVATSTTLKLSNEKASRQRPVDYYCK